MMEISLTPEQSDVVRHAVETGRVHDSEEAMHQAIGLWVERERRRAELISSLDAAEASLAGGEGLEITTASMDTLARDVMERCAERAGAGLK